MKTLRLLPMLVAGLLMLPALPSRANVDSYLNLQLVCYQQSELECVDDVWIGRVAQVRIGSRDVLRFISNKLEIDFPNGSRILITTDGEAYVVAPRRFFFNRGPSATEETEVEQQRWHVTECISASLDTEYDLFHGRYNKLTEQENSTIYFPLALWMWTPNGRCHVEGIAIERFTASPPRRDRQTFAGTIISQVNGYSGLRTLADEVEEGEEGLIFYQGRVILQGREVVELSKQQ